MKHPIVTLSVCLAVALAFGMTGTLAGQDYQPPKSEEVSLTGCLVQGTGPAVFILENAKVDPSDRSQNGRSYLLAASSSSVSFREHLNHEVRIDGMAEVKMVPDQPAGQPVKESDLPKLKATKLTHVASTCSQPLN